MSNPSNLYAEKIFAEHPSVLWALDDNAEYISLVSESNRNFDNGWSISGGSRISSPAPIFKPFDTSALNLIQGNVPSGDTNEIILISPDIKNFTALNQYFKTFCIGTYFYSDSPYIQSVSLGYEYTDTTTSLIVQKFKTFNSPLLNKWQFISETFEIPNENTNFRILLKVMTVDGGLSTSQYQFYTNGLSLGQWNENFNATSLGQTKINLPAVIKSDSLYAIEAQAYGIEEFSGYYIVEDDGLMASNNSIPMVYGAKNITRLHPNNNKPSLILPGKGFLNKEGRYKDYTVEFWIRANSNTLTAKKIFGPISSNDGLYVDSGFLTFVIGDKFISHFVGEWFRPMLLDIRVSRNLASLLINGEQVGSIVIDLDSFTLPTKFDELNKDQDWLGFYAYEDVDPVEIDCVAIYPYQVSEVMAKRRFVYGQGVVSPEGINSSYGGTSAFIDYGFANYSVNYSYPSFGKWDQATFDNLLTTQTSITTPNYQLPQIFLDTKTLNNLYLDNNDIQNETNNFFTFRPDSTWNNLNTYINFNRFSFLGSPVRSVWGIFKESDNEDDQILFRLYNDTNSNSFNVIKKESTIEYSITYNGSTEVLRQEVLTNPTNSFCAGFDIQSLIDGYGNNIASFFGNQNTLKMYCLGDNLGTKPFTGKIYNISLSTSKNYSYISSNFDSYGVLDTDSVSNLINYTGSYSVLPIKSYDSFYLDIGVAGYWQDYLPLSYFAKYVTNDVGNKYYDLDFIQFNINNSPPSKLLEQETVSSWKYGEPTYVGQNIIQSLEYEYRNPISKTYSQLANNLLTGWNDYEDMEQKSQKYFTYNTSSLPVRSFVTFQYIEDGANLLDDSFINIEPANEENIVDVNLYPSWDTTKFEVVDNSVIYPPNNVDFNKIAIVYSLIFNVRGIKTNPILIRDLQFASQALSQDTFNSIGTRFGVPIYPYKKSGFYYDYKSKNPFSIYKGSNPYLYLTRKSGIAIRGDFDINIDRGLAIPINPNKAKNYKISAMQIWLRSDKDKFPGEKTKIFEIEYLSDTIEFYMVANSKVGNRARIFALSKSNGKIFNGLIYYIDGLMVREPVITMNQWASLGIGFASSLSYDLFSGYVNLHGPLVFNNIAYYEANSLQQVQSRINRPWLQVKEDPFTELEWQYWKNNFNWDEMLTIATTDIYGVNPASVYQTYIGTNKIIIDDDDILQIDINKVKIYGDITRLRTTVIPV